MTTPPARPKLYHITHVDNLRVIAADGELLSDAAMIARGGPVQAIGMSGIKRRRIEELEVACHPGTKVGDYVPFYFCPRSVMLYVIHCANHPELIELVERIGVRSAGIQARAATALAGARHRPPIEVRREWYF